MRVFRFAVLLSLLLTPLVVVVRWVPTPATDYALVHVAPNASGQRVAFLLDPVRRISVAFDDPRMPLPRSDDGRWAARFTYAENRGVDGFRTRGLDLMNTETGEIRELYQAEEEITIAWGGSNLAVRSAQNEVRRLDVYDPVADAWHPLYSGRVFINFGWGAGHLAYAFVLRGEAPSRLRVWHADSATVVREIEGEGGQALWYEWSPDGTHLAHVGAGDSLVLWTPATDAETHIAVPSVENLAWSPGGTQLAVQSVEGRGRSSVHLVRLDGTTRRVMTTDGTIRRSPAWGAAGDWLRVIRSADGELRAVTYDVGSIWAGEPRIVHEWTLPGSASFQWSADGRFVHTPADATTTTLLDIVSGHTQRVPGQGGNFIAMERIHAILD